MSVELPVGRIVGVNHLADTYPAEVLAATAGDSVVVRVLVDLKDDDGDLYLAAGSVVVMHQLYVTYDDLAAEAPEYMPVTIRRLDSARHAIVSGTEDQDRVVLALGDWFPHARIRIDLGTSGTEQIGVIISNGGPVEVWVAVLTDGTMIDAADDPIGLDEIQRLLEEQEQS